jgi:MYXO-CTERM domain-containing protein
VTSIGQVTCNTVEYNKDQGNANIYLFVDDEWMASGPGNALALTTVWYDWKTGEIYDADVEVNGAAGDITNGDPGDGADLLSIITHESGHFLGLDHSPFNSSATMYTTYDPGHGNLRVLDADDIAGICAVYPPDRVAAGNECGPRHGFSSTCRKDDSGCALSAGSTSSSAPWLALAAGVALGLLRRRRR